MNREQIFKEVSKTANTTVLSFPDRGPWGNSNYRGNFSGWIPASLIYRYDVNAVSEIFAGGGTTSDLCKDLGISYCGIDLNPNPVRNDIVSMDILDEEAKLPIGFYEADLQILHPPYPCINNIHYSNGMWKDTKGVANKDIQEMSWEEGMKAINKALLRGYAAMPNGSYQACVVGDVRRKGEFRSMMADLAIPGELVQVLIKLQHNTVSGRNTNAYAGKRNFFLLEHEYVMVIKKPSGYEIAYVVPKKYSMDIRDSHTATWDDVIAAVLRRLNKVASLDEIYEEVKYHKKAQGNPSWEAKVRQTLQSLRDKGFAINTERGYWRAAA